MDRIGYSPRVAAAVAAALGLSAPMGVAFAQPVVRRRHRARGNHRHGDPPRGERPGHPVQHRGARVRRPRRPAHHQPVRVHARRPGPVRGQPGPARQQPDDGARPERQLDQCQRVRGQRHGRHGRDLPRRHPALRRPQDARHGARRGAARPAGHAVRRGHARRRHPLPAEPARPEPDRSSRSAGGPMRSARATASATTCTASSTCRSSRTGSRCAWQWATRTIRGSSTTTTSSASRASPTRSRTATIRRRWRPTCARSKDADTEETLTGRAALLWNITDAVDGQPDLLLPAAGRRGAHGQPRPRVRHGQVRLGPPVPRAERQEEPAARARAHLGPRLCRADLGHGRVEVRVERPARPDRPADGLRLRLRGLPAVRRLRARRPGGGDLQPGSAPRVAGHGALELDRRRVLQPATKRETSSEEHTPGIPEWYGLPPGTPDLEYLAKSDADVRGNGAVRRGRLPVHGCAGR